jgi:putative transposase
MYRKKSGNATTGNTTTGNANLRIGERTNAIRENGVPREDANPEIGVPREDANPEIGVPNAPRGWHSRGYLPHYDDDEKIQHVTFHLADSLPSDVVHRMDAELKALPPEKRDVEHRKRVEAWLDASHGSCVLRQPRIAGMVEDSLRSFDGQRYYLLAWVVMPNHVHVLFQPAKGGSVAKIVASWKRFTATQICTCRRAATPGNADLPIGPGNADLLIGAANATFRTGPGNVGLRTGTSPQPVWHREYRDRFIRNEGHLLQAVQYIHQNPVKAGLVVRAEDWLWSSARFAGNADQEIGDPRKDP